MFGFRGGMRVRNPTTRQTPPWRRFFSPLHVDPTYRIRTPLRLPLPPPAPPNNNNTRIPSKKQRREKPH